MLFRSCMMGFGRLLIAAVSPDAEHRLCMMGFGRLLIAAVSPDAEHRLCMMGFGSYSAWAQ